MKSKYGISKEESKQIIVSFLRVIEDASDYLFSKNHSDPYSMIGFATAYLRTYYPLEFLTTVMQMNDGNLDKTSRNLEYMNENTSAKMSPAKFKKSKGEYFPDLENDVIYKGIGSIKNLNTDIGNKLYELSQNSNINSFFDLLEASILNKTQVETLTKIDFFSEFGKAKKLMNFYEVYRKWRDKKTIKKANIMDVPFDVESIKSIAKETDKKFSNIDFEPILKDYWDKLEDVDYSIVEKIEQQKEYLGYINLNLDVEPNYCLVLDMETKGSTKLQLQSLANGSGFEAKIRKRNMDKRLKIGSIIYISNMNKEFGWKPLVDEEGNQVFDNKGKLKFEQNKSKMEWIIQKYHIAKDIELQGGL